MIKHLKTGRLNVEKHDVCAKVLHDENITCLEESTKIFFGWSQICVKYEFVNELTIEDKKSFWARMTSLDYKTFYVGLLDCCDVSSLAETKELIMFLKTYNRLNRFLLVVDATNSRKRVVTFDECVDLARENEFDMMELKDPEFDWDKVCQNSPKFCVIFLA